MASMRRLAVCAEVLRGGTSGRKFLARSLVAATARVAIVGFMPCASSSVALTPAAITAPVTVQIQHVDAALRGGEFGPYGGADGNEFLIPVRRPQRKPSMAIQDHQDGR